MKDISKIFFRYLFLLMKLRLFIVPGSL